MKNLTPHQQARSLFSKTFLTATAAAFALGLIILAIGAASARAQGVLSVDEILKKTTQGVYSGSEESVYLMKLSGGDGVQATRKMKVSYRRPDASSAKLLIKFQEPADIRGTGLLSIIEKDKPADQWIYLPNLKKTRRIKGGNESESFLGSDFTVGDLTTVESENDRYTYSMTENASHYLITGIPKAGVELTSLPYSKKVIQVRKDNFMATHIDFYNADNKIEKTLELRKLHQESLGWIADQMEMKNLLTGHSTAVEVVKRDVSKTPSDAGFTQSALERN